MLEEVEPEWWDELLRSLGITDVYYSRGFVEASAPLAGGVATFLRSGDVVFPCVVRSDPVDVVTPDGYGGAGGGGLVAGVLGGFEAGGGGRGVLWTVLGVHPLVGNVGSSGVVWRFLAG